MQSLWQRLEKIAAGHNLSLHLRPGASADAIAAAEQAIGLTFPASYRASLLAHDGQDASKGDVFEWMPGCSPLASLEAVVAQWKDERNYDDDFGEPRADDDDRVLSHVKHPRRIPIAGNQWWDGDNTYLDFIVGPKGTEGQVITFFTECDLCTLGATFEQALTSYVEALESGAWVYDATKKHVVPKGEQADVYPNESYEFAKYLASLQKKTP
jgi:cell wall assembly regulator SMI1